MLSLAFIVVLAWNGSIRIANRCGVRILSVAEMPILHCTVEEYCRRLEIPKPKLGIIEVSTRQCLVFGFSLKDSYLVITRGIFEDLKREELSAIVGQLLVYIWHREFILESWLSRFLAIMEPLIGRKARPVSRRVYSFQLFFRQILFYPLLYFPSRCLSSAVDPIELDQKASRLTQRPMELASAYRKIESGRSSIQVPLDLRHLFIIQPPPDDPMAGIFFESGSLLPRVRQLEGVQ